VNVGAGEGCVSKGLKVDLQRPRADSGDARGGTNIRDFLGKMSAAGGQITPLSIIDDIGSLRLPTRSTAAAPLECQQ